jgi:hypothetical protein
MTVSPLKQSVDAPDREQFAVLVLEMAAERLSLEADGVLPGQKCPTFMPERASPADWPVNSIRETICSCQKRTYWPSVRAAIGSDRSCVGPTLPR